MGEKEERLGDMLNQNVLYSEDLRRMKYGIDNDKFEITFTKKVRTG
jgi:hypothetical protein